MNVIRIFRSFRLRSTFNKLKVFDGRDHLKDPWASVTYSYYNHSNNRNNFTENSNIDTYLISIVTAGACFWYIQDAECEESEQKHETFVRDKPISKRRRTPNDAKPYLANLVEHFITPVELFYVKDRPQPDIDLNNYKLHVEDESTATTNTFTINDLETNFEKVEITAVVMTWSGIACGNARWTGVRLCDLLNTIGVKNGENSLIILEGCDKELDGSSYAASLPLSKALNPEYDIILAYKMNGEPLKKQHGSPLRCIIPGVAGARQVKWLGRIVVTNMNLSNIYGKSDDCESAGFRLAPEIQDMEVTSVICALNSVNHNGKFDQIEIKGYACSGGGNKVTQVDVSWDYGKTWHATNLTQSDDDSNVSGRHYAWTLWSINIPMDENQLNIEVWSKAVDSGKNYQHEVFKFSSDFESLRSRT